MTAQQILEVISEHYSVHNFAYGEWNSLEDLSLVEAQYSDFENAQKSKDEFQDGYGHEVRPQQQTIIVYK